MALAPYVRRHDKPLRFIDPDAGGGGTGTFESPWNTWAAAVKEPNTAYLQKAGTTATLGAITDLDLRSLDSISLGVYTSEGPVQRRGVEQATLDGSGVTYGGWPIVDFRDGSNHDVRDLILNGGTVLRIGTPLAGVSFSSSSVDQHGLVLDNVKVLGATRGLLAENGISRITLLRVVTEDVEHGISAYDVVALSIVDSDIVGDYGDGIDLYGAGAGDVADISLLRTRLRGSRNAARLGTSSTSDLVMDRCRIEGEVLGLGTMLLKACLFLQRYQKQDEVRIFDAPLASIYNCTFARMDAGIQYKMGEAIVMSDSNVVIKNCLFNSVEEALTFASASGTNTLYYSNCGHLVDDLLTLTSGIATDGGGHVQGDLLFTPDFKSVNDSFKAAGVAVAGVEIDYAGNPFAMVQPSIGAHELREAGEWASAPERSDTWGAGVGTSDSWSGDSEVAATWTRESEKTDEWS